MGSATRATIAAAAMGVLLTLPGPAGASWPMARHDAKRSGAATGKSDMKKHVPYFRTYLGGAIAANQLAQADV